MGSFLGALVAVAGALIVAYVTNFVAHHYRLFKERTVLAAAFVGELSSYQQGLKVLQQMLPLLARNFREGPSPTPLPFDPPRDLVYESQVAKIGLLGVDAAEAIAYVYQRFAAARVAFHNVCDSQNGLSAEQRALLVDHCTEANQAVEKRLEKLLPNLRAQAADTYCAQMAWPQWLKRRRGWRRILVLALCVWGMVGFLWGNHEGIKQGDVAASSYQLCLGAHAENWSACSVNFQRDYAAQIAGHYWWGLGFAVAVPVLLGLCWWLLWLVLRWVGLGFAAPRKD
ncbi:MAG: hypothetical protein ABI216_04140 [Devosia sp.]